MEVAMCRSRSLLLTVGLLMACVPGCSNPTPSGQSVDAVAPSPLAEGSWWTWVVSGSLIGSAAPERAPGGEQAWLSAMQEAAGGASLAVLNLKVKSYPDLEAAVASYAHIPVQDFTPPSPEQADEAVMFISDNIGAGRLVVVHCHGGCGRTGTILAAYLKRESGLSGADAIASLRKLNSCFVETDGQEQFIESY